MKKLLFALVLILVVILAACNLPGAASPTPEGPEAAFTRMAETVNAELTRVAGLATWTPSLPPLPSDTPIPTPTFTVPAPPTKTPIPCLAVGWSDATIDVTVPDNTVMAPGQVFTKTWRLTNIGTCTWNSAYQLIFDHGDPMGVSTTYAQPLTSTTVAPGQTVDVTVSLTAPATTGTYTGYWRFRDPGGVVFGLAPNNSPWIVKIKVANTVTLLPVLSESGVVDSAGTVALAGAMIGMGDDITNNGSQMFITYSLSSIPSNAVITEVKLDMRNSTLSGNPFAGLGVLNLYKHDYGTLDASDYTVPAPGGNIADWGSAAALNTLEASPELKALVQSKLSAGKVQLRFQFITATDSDGTLDAVIYLPTGSVFNNPALIVSYTTP